MSATATKTRRTRIPQAETTAKYHRLCEAQKLIEATWLEDTPEQRRVKKQQIRKYDMDIQRCIDSKEGVL
ncbi:MAG: hypothetical protein NUW01_11455 [Gemmatimonadaceae bacterium]|nr:hypothetical protein [Gemmatimonadaceae bacterium]